MSIREFEGYIEGARGLMMQTLIEESGDINAVVFSLFVPLTNGFEEETLTENLSEVFREYLEMVRAA